MKKYNPLYFLLFSFILFIGCNASDQSGEDAEETREEVLEKPAPSVQENSNDFDISSISTTDKLTGAFPYFQLPAGYTFTSPQKNHGEGIVQDYDMEFFLLNGRYQQVEGKTFKAEIIIDKNNHEKTFSRLELLKNFDEFIETIGGVKVNNGTPISAEEKKRIREENPEAYKSGYLHSSNNYNDVHTYIIRPTEKTIWVQYNIGKNRAYYTLLETETFESTLAILEADEIIQGIAEKGRAILYINFDIDKATLRPDGKAAVNEIAKALNKDSSLNVSIEGHTDDSGTVEQNQLLSENRAQTVLNELVTLGINKSRMQAVGHGQEHPLTLNDSEESKAKNRRVELVKL